MSTINKGDLIRCIDAEGTRGLLKKGKLYTAALVSFEGGSNRPMVMVSRVTAYFSAQRFELASDGPAIPVAKSKKGGARPGSGRKPKYGEPSATITVRVPKAQAGVIRARINGILSEYL